MGLCFSSGHKSKVSPTPETLKTTYEILQSLQFLNLKRYEFPELTVDLGNNLVFAEVVHQNDFHAGQDLLEKIKHVQELSHPNFMKLIGFCLKDEKWLLVYEYVACRLNDYLRGIGSDYPPVTWSVCMKIVVGIAKGLAFLHHEAQLMYGDFNPRHVLLDLEGNAKLSDVGLVKERPAVGRHQVYHARLLGTPGYAAPEFISTGALTAKCNVYSFGMILLEILSGKVATRIERPRKNEDGEEWAANLVDAAEKDSRGIVTNEFGSIQEKQHLRSNVLKLAQLAFKCVSDDPTLRPDMNYVVQFLELH